MRLIVNEFGDIIDFPINGYEQFLAGSHDGEYAVKFTAKHIHQGLDDDFPGGTGYPMESTDIRRIDRRVIPALHCKLCGLRVVLWDAVMTEQELKHYFNQYNK